MLGESQSASAGRSANEQGRPKCRRARCARTRVREQGSHAAPARTSSSLPCSSQPKVGEWASVSGHSSRRCLLQPLACAQAGPSTPGWAPGTSKAWAAACDACVAARRVRGPPPQPPRPCPAAAKLPRRLQQPTGRRQPLLPPAARDSALCRLQVKCNISIFAVLRLRSVRKRGRASKLLPSP